LISEIYKTALSSTEIKGNAILILNIHLINVETPIKIKQNTAQENIVN